MAEENKYANAWESLINDLIEEKTKQFEDIETIGKKASKEISFHKRDLYSLMREAEKKSKDELKNLEAIRKEVEEGKVEDAIKRYEEIFEDVKAIDEDFAIGLLTIIAILRYSAQYYYLREKYDRKFNEIGDYLKENASDIDRKLLGKIDRIQEENKKVSEKINEVVEQLVKTTHRRVPKGELVMAASALAEVLADEDVDSWVEKNFLAKRTSGKKVSKKIKE